MVTMEPCKEMLGTHSCFTGYDDDRVMPDKTSRILFANLEKSSGTILKRHMAAHVMSHSLPVPESNIAYEEIFK